VVGARPFATTHEAQPAHLMLAEQILRAPQSSDPTGGATSFFEPKLQDEAVRYGEMCRRGQATYRLASGKIVDTCRFRDYRKPAAQIRSEWTKGGSRVVASAGRFEFYGKPGRVTA
jgi:hypothetical protein